MNPLSSLMASFVDFRPNASIQLLSLFPQQQMVFSESIECEFVQYNGYIKMQCTAVDTVENKTRTFFKCPNSNQNYTVLKRSCSVQQFSAVCPNDPMFYQVCSHKVLVNNDMLIIRVCLHTNLGLYLASRASFQVLSCGQNMALTWFNRVQARLYDTKKSSHY